MQTVVINWLRQLEPLEQFFCLFEEQQWDFRIYTYAIYTGNQSDKYLHGSVLKTEFVSEKRKNQWKFM